MSQWKARPFLAILVASVMLHGCVGDNITVIRENDKGLEMQDWLVSAAEIDLSRVVVAKIRLGGEPREVTSILPMVIAEAKTENGVARTIFRLNAKTDTLTLFTRDGKNKTAYRADIPIQAAAKDAQPVKFPIIEPNGKLTEKAIVIEKVLSR
jgi:hypothetical protein